jgi:hypothetical protein
MRATGQVTRRHDDVVGSSQSVFPIPGITSLRCFVTDTDNQRFGKIWLSAFAKKMEPQKTHKT